MKGELRNAMIKSASIQIDRGFACTIWVNLDYGSGGQGFGGYVLSSTTQGAHPLLGEWVMALMKLFSVERWADLKNIPCRVEADHSHVYRIGHFTKDEWFDPKELADSYQDDAGKVQLEKRAGSA